jgi:hypothetical protein
MVKNVKTPRKTQECKLKERKMRNIVNSELGCGVTGKDIAVLKVKVKFSFY